MPSKKKKYNARFPPVSTWPAPGGAGPTLERPGPGWGGGRIVGFGGPDATPPPPFSGIPLLSAPSTEFRGEGDGVRTLCSLPRRGSRRSCRLTRRLGRWRRLCLSSSVSCRGLAGLRDVGKEGDRGRPGWAGDPPPAFSLTPVSPGPRALPGVAVEEGLPGDPVPKRQDHDHFPPVSGGGTGRARWGPTPGVHTLQGS